MDRVRFTIQYRLVVQADERCMSRYPSREMICDSKRTHIFFNRYVDGHSRQPFLVFIDRQKYLANNPKANPRTRRRLLEGHSLYDFIMYHPHNLPLDTDSQEIGEGGKQRESM